TCSGVDMPDSTASTPSSPAANRRAQDTMESSGRWARISASAASGAVASIPLYRLHDDDLSAVGADGLIAPAGLDIPGVPVEVVQGNLHRLHLRVLREDLVQHIGGVME